MSPTDLAVVLAIAALVLLSAMVSGSETAVTAASRAWLEEAGRRGLARAHLAARLLQDRERLVTAILIGNNLVNILATALATAWLTDRLGGGEAVALATAGMTVVLVVCGEVLPKTWAIRRPETAALAVAPLLRLLVALTAPFTALLLRLAREVQRVGGSAARGFALVPPLRYLRATVASWAERGLISPLLRELLEGVLRLDELEVRHVMVHRTAMVTLPASLDLGEALVRIRHLRHSRFPVTGRGGEDDVVGVVHLRRLVEQLDEQGRPPAGVCLGDIADPVWFVPETTPLAVQLRAFQRRRRHMAIVTDEYGSVQGLVTLEDVLEEVVGEIADEKDVPEEPVERLPDGSLVVAGRMPLAELARRFRLELPLEPLTVAGLVMELAGRLPEVGEHVRCGGLELEVLARDGPRILQVRIYPRTAGSETEEEGG